MSGTSWSQEGSRGDDLAEALASLTEQDIPPEDADRDWRDPDTSCPAELAGLSDVELDEVLAAAVPAAPSWRTEPSWPADPAAAAAGIPAGCLPRDGSGGGTGFCDGGVLDVLAAGLALAGFAEDAHEVQGRAR